MGGGVSTSGIFLYVIQSDSLLSRKRETPWFRHIYKRGSDRLFGRSFNRRCIHNFVFVLSMKTAESSSLKFKFTQKSGASCKGAPVWFDGNIGFCPICQGTGKVRCFDCNGYGIHPWAVVDERLAGGQPCKLCKGARVVSCPVCAPHSYKSLRASVLGISLSQAESESNVDNLQEEQDDNWVLQPTSL
ncbi:hypothetical protein Gasu2_27360 [Galdieria sulphuraria]|uniref:BSD2 cysteine rich domain-containing protein n=1 Tax=Galdieria sulphuraria TaxID=130081 RepID=M2XJH4_GALSU|nr:uncharacterized protein Gasu_24170 [Galdieria sulphuraria]EME30267.1 hypothetical protein Gasu_24170 [Galdieria sulphuraria]GJD08432.1 hypothetical protein Gasu2_27360 [Galdieria sulphuraria]|eukprot:XP_005706787.1 hypothetical protein Gasu_24170 [Galdieria sulphuraria]